LHRQLAWAAYACQQRHTYLNGAAACVTLGITAMQVLLLSADSVVRDWCVASGQAEAACIAHSMATHAVAV
jgi:hypothetical protein